MALENFDLDWFMVFNATFNNISYYLGTRKKYIQMAISHANAIL
jgi:hypothetical protein